jgi:CRP-like cAMP-binding protein
LTDAEITLLSEQGEYRYFNTRAIAAAEGAVSDAVYVIAGGLVDVAVRLPDGSRKVVETLGPGNHFGITAMLETEPSFLEYAANTDVTLIRIDLDCVRGIVAQRPELAAMLTRVIKERLDAAEAQRVASRQPARRLTLRDIRLGVERRMRGPSRGASQKPDV